MRVVRVSAAAQLALESAAGAGREILNFASFGRQ
jgi:hypothetical protein